MSQPRPQRGLTPESAYAVKRGVRQLRDPMIKKSEKVLIIIGILYLVSPIDFLPDLIPFVGLADDFVITGGAVTVAVIRIVFRAAAQKVQRTVDERQPRPPLQ